MNGTDDTPHWRNARISFCGKTSPRILGMCGHAAELVDHKRLSVFGQTLLLVQYRTMIIKFDTQSNNNHKRRSDHYSDQGNHNIHQTFYKQIYNAKPLIPGQIQWRVKQMNIIRSAEQNVRNLWCNICADRFLITVFHNLITHFRRQITQNHRIIFLNHRIQLFITNPVTFRCTDIILVFSCVDFSDQIIRRIISINHKHLTRRIQTCICLSHQYDPRNDKYNLCYRHQKQWLWRQIIVGDQTDLEIRNNHRKNHCQYLG